MAGNHPSGEMQIMEQNGNMVRFKMKNVDLSFTNGPMFGVSFDDYLDFSYGVISEFADYMNAEFSHEMADKIWYEVTLSAK